VGYILPPLTGLTFILTGLTFVLRG
jgi:hypothetical protein